MAAATRSAKFFYAYQAPARPAAGADVGWRCAETPGDAATPRRSDPPASPRTVRKSVLPDHNVASAPPGLAQGQDLVQPKRQFQMSTPPSDEDDGHPAGDFQGRLPPPMVITKNPIPQGLTVHPRRSRRLFPRLAFYDQRKSQQTPRNGRISCSCRPKPQSRSIKNVPGDADRRRHHLPPPVNIWG